MMPRYGTILFAGGLLAGLLALARFARTQVTELAPDRQNF